MLTATKEEIQLSEERMLRTLFKLNVFVIFCTCAIGNGVTVNHIEVGNKIVFIRKQENYKVNFLKQHDLTTAVIVCKMTLLTTP